LLCITEEAFLSQVEDDILHLCSSLASALHMSDNITAAGIKEAGTISSVVKFGKITNSMFKFSTAGRLFAHLISLGSMDTYTRL
jgi:hypothetical protein